MKITIDKFQRLYAISNMDLNELDKSSRLVQCLTDVSEADIDAMPIKKFNKLCASLKGIFELKTNGVPSDYIIVNGRRYKIIYNVTDKEFNAGKYVEVSTFAKDIIGNLHKYMASIVIPMRFNWLKFRYEKVEMSHNEIAEEMLDADFFKCYHSAVFFYVVYTKTIENLQPYLVKEMKSKGMTDKAATEALINLRNTLAGFTMPKWCQNLKT